MIRLVRGHRDERGATMVVFGVLLTSGLLFGLGAMAVDLGQMYEVRREAQSAADLAALAGGDALQMNPADPTTACNTALAYLHDNSPHGTPLPSGLSCTATGTNDSSIDTNGDGVGDASVVTITSGLKTTIRVVVPRQRVNFGFAEAFGVDHSSVTAGATVALKSAGAVMPFAVPTGCLATGYDWYFDVKTGSSGQDAGPCGESAGNFGLLNFGGGGGGDPQVVDSIKNGGPPIDYVHVSAADLTADPAPDDPACPEGSGTEGDIGTIGATQYTANWDNNNPSPAAQPIPNCVAVESGLKASALLDGLVGKNGCDGRLVVQSSSVRQFDGCNLDATRFAQYWKTGYTATDVRSGTPGSVSSDIVHSKNFMVVPVIYANKRPSSSGGSQPDGWVPVVGLMGLFLDCPYPTGATLADMQNPALCTQPFGDVSQIKELRGYLFDLKTIDPSGLMNDGEPLQNYYTGAGPAVPVLVKDPLN